MSAGGGRYTRTEKRRGPISGVVVDMLIAGLAGGLASSIPHTLLDLADGEPLRTPVALYGALIGSGGSPAAEALLYSGVHLAVWCAIGLVLALVARVVDLRPSAGAGAFFLALLGFCTAVSLASGLSGSAALGMPVWIGTGTGAIAAMAALALRHRSSLDLDRMRGLTETTLRDLDLAYQEECRALELYRAARGAHPRVRWLEVLESQAERNLDRLDELFERYGLARPHPDAFQASLPVGGPDAVAAEVIALAAGRRALYDRFLVVVDEPLVRTLFERLRSVADRAMSEDIPLVHDDDPAWRAAPRSERRVEGKASDPLEADS